MHTTKQLLHSALDGDPTARSALFDRHLGRLLTFARARMTRRARGVAAPDDIVQETHLEALRKLSSFEDRGPASFYRWLVAIARFKIAEADRAAAAKKRQAVPLDVQVPAAVSSPSGRAMRHAFREHLEDALQSVGEARAEAVRLRYLEGLSLKETADRLDRTAAAVKALVSRGLADLAERLGQHS